MATVTCCELAPQLGSLEDNLAMAQAAIAAAAAEGADVIVLPELATSGYCFETAAEARANAITANHSAFEGWSSAAGSALVVAGFAELGADGQVYNSAIMLDRDGPRAVYRKTHLWDSELLFFAPGAAPPPVIGTRVGRVAMMICYDLEFPEMTRSVALRGADLVAVPTNWPWVERPEGMPAPEVVIAMAAARVNRISIACCDRRGIERTQRWNEATTIINADGWPVAQAAPNTTATAELDLTASREKFISSRNHVLTDRRPDIY